MKVQELLKQLHEIGCRIVRHGKEHDMYSSPITGNVFPVPRHKKEISIGTLNNIKKAAGLK